ncbi:MAG: hypothetical protein R2748_09520 [Bryobacterales bacterium]
MQCLEHDAVWNFLDTTPWARRLFDKALTHSETLKSGDMRTNVKDPSVFRIEYNDGLEAAAFLSLEPSRTSTVAIDVPGRPEPVSTLMYLQNGRPHPHFGCLVMNIEKMFETGVATYPVQRTLLTSGMLDFALESRFQGHKRLATPQLDVDYWVGRDSHFCVGPLDEPPRSE